MRYLQFLFGMMVLALLAACGGGGGSSGTSPGGSTSVVSKVAAVELFASAATLDSASPTGITLTTMLKDKNNQVVEGEAFVFSATSGVLQKSATTISDAAGKGTVKLIAGADRSSRTIDVTVTAGTVSKTMTISVQGTTVVVNGSASMLLGASTTYVVSVKDSAGVAMVGIPLSVTSSSGNSLSANSITTNESGSASFNYTPTRIGNGEDVIAVVGAGVSTLYKVSFGTLDFSFQNPATGAQIPVNKSSTVTVRLRSNGVGVEGKTISFSSTRGSVDASLVKTNANGEASTTVSSSTAGPSSITAKELESGTLTSLKMDFVAEIPDSIFLQANVNAIAPNVDGSAANRVVLTAVVRDKYGNAVKGRAVNFSLLADTSGGTIENALGVTDSNGVVTAFFVPGAVSTASNGVIILATDANTGLRSDAAPLNRVTTLTVNRQSLFITFQYGNLIGEFSTSTYKMPFAVSVVDANGVPVVNQKISLSIYPSHYYKGYLEWDGTAWVRAGVLQCANEDGDVDAPSNPPRYGERDGILQMGEDINGDGRLTPGLPGVIAPAEVTTDANGQIDFSLSYGRQFAPWVEFDITARTLVAGTESKAVTRFMAVGLVSDFNKQASPPAGQPSPFWYGEVKGFPNQRDLRCANPN